MTEEQEKQEFMRFIGGLYAEVKHRNKLAGRQLMEQSKWDALSEREKDVEVVAAFLRLSPFEMMHVVQIAHNAIQEVNKP